MAEEEDVKVPVSRYKPQKCNIYAAVEGWVIYVSGIHSEASEDDVQDLFCDYGRIKNFQTNFDKKTGSFKGYALIGYDEFESAQNAIKALNGFSFMSKKLSVDFAFRCPT